jgi:nucleoside-triphosphatase THEP1
MSFVKIAYTIAPGRGETNVLLADTAKALAADGLHLCGTVQTDTECADKAKCDMDVHILPDGPVIRISQDLGSASRGCRLNPEALEQAVQITGEQLDQGADLVIVNKFGKHEADGRGFREVIGEALSRDIPVLVGINRMNVDAFQDFCGAAAQELDPTVDALTTWAKSNLAAQKA